jgi:predicted small metal-binding protein
MAKILACKDAGADCDFVARGETEEEILRKCADHAKTAHNMKKIPKELRTKIRSLIREEWG